MRGGDVDLSIKDILWNDKFIGIQGLLCAIAGILFNYLSKFFIYGRISNVFGFILSTAMLMIFIRKNLVGKYVFWIKVISLTVINVFFAILFHSTRDIELSVLAPALVIELSFFYILTGHLVRKDSEN
jgi:hypothetical protein